MTSLPGEGRCPRCGAPVPLDALGCPGCGLSRAEAARLAPPAPPRSGRHPAPLVTLAALVVLAMVVAGVALRSATADDEPEAGGDTTAATTAPPATVPTPPDVVDELPVRARAELGGTIGERVAPVGEAVAATVGGDFTTGEMVLVGADGDVRWRADLGIPLGEDPLGVVANAEVVVTRAVGGDGVRDLLVARRARDGEEAWTRDVASTGLLALQMTATADLVVVTAADSVVALEPATGEERWRHEAPIVVGAAVDGDRVVVAEDRIDGQRPQILTLGLADGEELDSIELPVESVDVRWPVLAGGGDAVVVAGDGEWARRFVGLDLAAGAVQGNGSARAEHEGAPLAVAGGVLLLATADTGTLLGLSLTDGSLRWANGHTALGLTELADGMVLTRGFDVAVVDPVDGGATVVMSRAPNVGGPPVRTEGGLVVVPEETGLLILG